VAVWYADIPIRLVRLRSSLRDGCTQIYISKEYPQSLSCKNRPVRILDITPAGSRASAGIALGRVYKAGRVAQAEIRDGNGAVSNVSEMQVIRGVDPGQM